MSATPSLCYKRQGTHCKGLSEMARTVAEVIARYGPKMRARFATACRQAKLSFPPKHLLFLAFKEERRLELWGADGGQRYRFLAAYPILAASGTAGLKCREGDRQVPEGFYKLTALNPNSRFHLSIRVDYPNAEDIARSTVPREQMGGDIYIHGNAVSIGCLAMGDPAIEELFPLVATVGLARSRIWILPCDLRTKAPPATEDPATKRLYLRLKKAVSGLT